MTLLPGIQRDLVDAARRAEARPPARRGWRSRSFAVIATAVFVGAGAAFAADRVLNNSPGQFPDQYRFGLCPQHVTALPTDALVRARRAAVQQAPAAYPRLRNPRGVRAVDAQIVTHRTARSADAARCGLYDRTVLVELDLANAGFHSASMAQGAVYVSHIDPPGRAPYWELWGVEH